jgi:hypothetical protein
MSVKDFVPIQGHSRVIGSPFDMKIRPEKGGTVFRSRKRVRSKQQRH